MSLPPHIVASQLKILIPVGTADGHRRDREKGVGAGTHADGEHVVRPDAQADKADANRCRHHGGVAENGFAREDRDDFVGEREGRA